MGLRRMQVTDFRCLHSAELEFDPHLTLITGPNASGKTSLLEAIYVLGRGRSFRTRRLDNLIQATTDRFVVFGEVNVGERQVPMGVEGTREGVRARLDHERVESLASLAALLPVQIIDPEVHRLIEEGPARRRRFLDWGVFHVEHRFVGQWQRYQQVLRQRNAALKTRQSRTAVSAWDGKLLHLGSIVDAARAAYVERLLPVARGIAEALLDLELDLRYRPGWPIDGSFEEALRASEAHEIQAGVTVVGPQRAELAIRLAGMPVKDRISRGQQKLLAASLLVAQVGLFPRDSRSRPTLLLDDPAAELDDERLLRLIRQLAAQSVQLVVTSLDTGFSALGLPGRRYAVAKGAVSPL